MKNNLKNITNPGFKTPSNYFEEVEGQIFHKLFLEKENAKKNAFKVPEGYFTNVEEAIISKTIATAQKPKVIPLYQNQIFRYAVSIAAIAVIFVSVFQFSQSSFDVSDGENYFSVTQYIENGYLPVTDYELEDWLSNEAINGDFLMYSDLTDEEILDYLSYTIDESLLIYED